MRVANKFSDLARGLSLEIVIEHISRKTRHGRLHQKFGSIDYSAVIRKRKYILIRLLGSESVDHPSLFYNHVHESRTSPPPFLSQNSDRPQVVKCGYALQPPLVRLMSIPIRGQPSSPVTPSSCVGHLVRKANPQKKGNKCPRPCMTPRTEHDTLHLPESFIL